ncbi:hypothetical protein PSECIP111854_00439 [Pseudoalteromonas sp. CIP111854]|uniref:HTH LytTR-type domain-containing protein n=1 Tax=Pseudoalteromonas holothuriae TaxID=2963714 RepID=A0A9W4VV70_9GAMM|nr:LytTR family DNA-binding domain-containing protein [Pseudoalteromonas sp. CIP111854]CAH9049977.1 hypothetical protein PSECIP111854_00439 [Pseudoalteromonas sp. CIP111854]
MDTLLKNQFYKLKDYQIILIGWALILTVVCLNCAVHSVLIAKERVDIASSIIWSLQKFGVWLMLTPMLCNTFNHSQVKSRVNHYLIVGIYAISFALAVNTTLDMAIEQITWQASLFYQWHNHLVAYATIVIVWHLKHSLFDAQPTQHTPISTAYPLHEESCSASLEQIETEQHQQAHLYLDDINIALADIVFIKAAGNYIEVTTPEQTHLLRATMKELEAHLPNTQFFRCHRSYFINLSHSQKVINARAGHGYIVLKNQQQVPVSKSKRRDAHQLIPI